MIIPIPKLEVALQRPVFLELKQLAQDLNQKLELAMDTLSMGMSDDFQTAILAGSTIIRIGQRIFGPRN